MLITQKLAEFIYDTTYESLPKDVIDCVKERVLDTIGVELSGYYNWDYSNQFLNACRKLDSGEHSTFCSKEKEFSIARAAMINSTFAHVMELDDGHKNAGVHAGAVIIPVALTLGEKLGSTGKEIINAITIGYEVVYRIASAMSPKQIQKGFHPSGNCDTFGALAVAGKLMKLNKEQLSNGLGLSGLYSAGLMEATVSGQQSKCIQVGNAAYNGISAAYMAESGLEGTITVFEGDTGLFYAQSENVDINYVCKDLGVVYSIRDTYSKLYPTCRHSQPGIEAALDIAEDEGFGYEEVEKVIVGTHQVGYDLTGIIKEPKDAGEAKFSLAYGIAIAIHERNFSAYHLSREYRENEINLSLARKVEVNVDPEVQEKFPGKRGAKVKIILKDGKQFEKECYDLKGSPTNPIGWDEIEKKFVGNITGILSESKKDKLIKYIKSMENIGDIKVITELLH